MAIIFRKFEKKNSTWKKKIEEISVIKKFQNHSIARSNYAVT